MGWQLAISLPNKSVKKKHNRQMLTKDEKIKIETWIIENINETIVPADEGCATGLIYNLVHLVRGDGERYDYKPEQDDEIKSWGLEV